MPQNDYKNDSSSSPINSWDMYNVHIAKDSVSYGYVNLFSLFCFFMR